VFYLLELNSIYIWGGIAAYRFWLFISDIENKSILRAKGYHDRPGHNQRQAMMDEIKAGGKFAELKKYMDNNDVAIRTFDRDIPAHNEVMKKFLKMIEDDDSVLYGDK
jgi:hypothetical protein